MPLDVPERPEIDDAQRVRQTDQQKERVGRECTGTTELDEDGGAEQQRADDDANRDEGGEPRPEIHAELTNPRIYESPNFNSTIRRFVNSKILYPVSLLIRLKIGMYIAMTIPPTM